MENEPNTVCKDPTASSSSAIVTIDPDFITRSMRSFQPLLRLSSGCVRISIASIDIAAISGLVGRSFGFKVSLRTRSNMARMRFAVRMRQEETVNGLFQ